MAEITVQENIWRDLIKVARKRRKKPEKLADQALREYLQRQADEELLAESDRAAKKTSFSISETEAIIREYRKRKKKS